MNRTILFCICAVLAAPVAVNAADETGRVTGRIEPGNQALASGYVAFYRAPGRKPDPGRVWRTPDHVASIEQDGSFDIAVPEGSYYIIGIRKAKNDHRPPEPGDQYFFFTDSNGPKVLVVKKGKMLELGKNAAVPAVFASDPAGDTVVKGIIQDEEGNPVPGIYVGADKKGLKRRKVDYISGMSDKNGMYELRLPEGGEYHIVARTRYNGGQPEAGHYYARLCKDDGFAEFRQEEFAGNYTIRRLADALRIAGILYQDEKSGTIGDLNKILKRAGLYEELTAAKEFQPSGTLIRYKETYDKTMKEEDLKRLNRIVLEEFFREETPKSKRNKPVKVKTGQTVVKNITVHTID